MDNKELYEKIKEELKEAKNEMRCMFISYKQEKLNIEKEMLYKERMEIENIKKFNEDVYDNNRYKFGWTNELQDEYVKLTQTQENQLFEILKKINKIKDEEKRNSDEISKLNI